MGNGAAKWAGLCTLYINVDPLEVARCLGELVDAFLGNGEVTAVAEVVSYFGFQAVDSCNDLWLLRCH